MKESNYIHDVLQRLKELGYNPIEEEYYSNIYLWLDWYKGSVEKFHKRKMFNGVKFCDDNIASLGLAKIFSQHWASLLFNDKTSITMDEKQQNVLDDLLANTRFKHYFRNTLEVAFACGTSATVEFKDGEDVVVNHIYGPMIFPLEQKNGEITSCAFASIDGDGYYVNIHLKQPNGTYRIINDWFRTNSLNGKVGIEPLEKEGIQKEFISPVKLFQIYKPNQVNSIDLFCPMGMSISANCIDQYKTADYAYSALQNEFRLGKKKIFVPIDTLTYKIVVGSDGKEQSVPIFDENQTEYYALPGSEQDTGFKEYNPALRINELQSGVELAINLAGMKAGFGENHFSFKDGKVYTNSMQVFSSNIDLRYNLMLHEDMLSTSLKELARALYYLKTGSVYEGDITIDFDNSIFEDENAKRNSAILELNNELIDNIQYYIDIYGMTKKQAIAFDKEIKERKAAEEPKEEPIETDEEDNEPSEEDKDSEPDKEE